jgi:5,5'-dehydrodivanillate O-demethylase
MQSIEAPVEVPVAPPITRRRSDVDIVTHTGPGTPAGEYMRRFWQPVMLSDELQSGRAKPVNLLGDLFTVFRADDGSVRALEGRCAHRGVQLSVGTVEKDKIRCLYHGWVYDSTGQCVERPAEREPNACTQIRIRDFPVHEAYGLIFLFVGSGEAPSPPRFLEFDDPGVLEPYSYERACNYFQNIDNGVDETHLAFTHPDSQFDILNYSVPEISAEETDYGLIQYGKRSDGAVHQAHFLMPNMLTFVWPASQDPAVDGWARYVSWRVPIDDMRHRTFVVEHFHVKEGKEEEFRGRRKALREQTAALSSRSEVCREILAGNSRLIDYVSRPDYVQLGDDVVQCAQGAIQDRSTERLGRSDVAVAMVRRMWVRELRTLESGGEPTVWKYPERLPRPHST